MIYLRLFFEFFKAGLFAIGGGMATVPFLQAMVHSTGWFTSDDLANMIAVAESTPGPLGINMGTYVGFTSGSLANGIAGGVLGALIATLGLVTPSVIVICLVAMILDKFRKSKYVDAAFYGLRAASVGLITAAGITIVLLAFFRVDDIYQFASQFSFNWKHVVLAVLIFVLTNNVKKTKKLHPIVFIVISALAGIVFRFAV